MQQSQTATIHGSVNTDTTPQYIRTDQGHVVSRINLRTTDNNGNRKANVKLKGNTLIDFTLPVGVNKTIGWCNDYKNSAIIYFVHNNMGNHSILRYFINTKTIQKIWYSRPDLDLEDSLIRASYVDDMLYWINGAKEPKSFNVTLAVNYTNNLGVQRPIILTTPVIDKYNADTTGFDYPLNEKVLPLIKTVPQFAPKYVQYGSDTAYNYNNLRKKLFQFKYCYEYKDKQRSAWSAISKVPLPVGELSYVGEWVEDIWVNNYIKLTVNTGECNVSKILVAARDCNPHNAGKFFVFETIEKYNSVGVLQVVDDSDYEIRFYNNKMTESIDTEVNERYCDHVPLAANDIMLLKGKWLSMAYPLSGYDEVLMDYTLTAAEEEIEFDVTSSIISGIKEWGYKGGLTWAVMWKIYLPDEYPANTSITLSFTYKYDNKNIDFTHTVVFGNEPVGNYPEDYRNQFLNACREYPDFDSSLFDDVPRSDYGLQIETKKISGLKYTLAVANEQYVFAVKSLKRGQMHPFAVVYNDGGGRYNIAFQDKYNGELFSPLVGSGVTDKNKRVVCDWAINNKPPIWAKTYRWAYIRQKTYSYFLYMPKIKIWTLIKDGANYEGIPAGKYMLLVNTALADMAEAYPNIQIDNYEFVNGDRIRKVGSLVSYEILGECTATPTDGTDTAYTGYLIDADLSDDDPDYTGLVEIYRQNPAPQDNIFYEIGEEFQILDAGTENRRHEGQFQDQIYGTQPATGRFDFGDVYFRMRYGAYSAIEPVEDMSFSDYYNSDSIDVGRVAVKTKAEQKRLNRVVRSENFLENTDYNLLNVWLPNADYFDASDVYGEITGIRQVGDVLKIIQISKETSVYIGQLAVKEANGSDMFIETDKVFGTDNPYVEIRGTKYNRSIVANDRYLYYFDENTGEVVRSAANGQIAISVDYMVNSWFQAKAKQLREYTGTKDVIITCDNAHSEVVVSFIIGGVIESFVFSEAKQENGWEYFATFYNLARPPEEFAYQGSTLVSFMNGSLYLHNVGANNTFYGRLHPCGIKFVANLPAYVSKRYTGIRVNSNKNIWDINFEIPEEGEYKHQKTILKPSLMKWINNRLHSDINGNILTKAGVQDIQRLYRGEDLVGEFMYVELTNFDNSDVILGEVDINFKINE